MRVRLLPYKGGSASCRALSKETGILRISLLRNKFRPRASDLIINWGCGLTGIPETWPCTNMWLNPPAAVSIASSKLASLSKMEEGGVNVPEFTTEPERAQSWLDKGSTVVVRSLDRASGGRGISLVKPGDNIPPARLYTLYKPKFDEYRVHVWGGEVLDVQQKKRRTSDGQQVTNQEIRNSENGWVFCREGVNAPAVVLDQAQRAVAALGLDFGAADVGFTRRGEVATVYEVNTAPGLEGTTLRKYADAAAAAVRGVRLREVPKSTR